MNYLVSIIVPCYNQAQYLPDALQSIYMQSHGNWECLIINDGSTDHTELVAQEWQEKDSRFRYIKKKNGGLSSARNAGLAEAMGDYIQFLDADDVIHPDKFRMQLQGINPSTRYAISYSDYFSSTEKKLTEPFPYHISPEFKTSNYLFELINRWEKSLSIPCHCFLISSHILKDNSITFDETLKNHEDWDFWMTIFRFKPSVFYIPKQLVTYRIHSSSMSRNYKQMKLGFQAAIKKQLGYFKFFSFEYLFLILKYLRVEFRITRQNRVVQLIFRIVKPLIEIKQQ